MKPSHGVILATLKSHNTDLTLTSWVFKKKNVQCDYLVISGFSSYITTLYQNTLYIFHMLKIHEKMPLFDGALAVFHCLKVNWATSRPNYFSGAALRAVLFCGPMQSSLITPSNVNRKRMPVAHSMDLLDVWLNVAQHNTDLIRGMLVRNFVWLLPVLQNVTMSHDRKTLREPGTCIFLSQSLQLLSSGWTNWEPPMWRTNFALSSLKAH